ncbi:MAG: hypothetical protein QY332_02005 [Anaerolineales bacterium]|nr:MAG: hypothetical protein QY332_02005 [Anaerolineales bacterium]
MMTHFYEIRIAGHLDAHWADWFDGMSITLEEDGTTLLSGPVPDQPALYGLLRKVRDLGLPLVSVNQITVTLNQQILNKKRSNTKMNTNNTTTEMEYRVSTTRIVGVVALAYAASMIFQNAVFAVTGAPNYSDPLGVVLTYHAENQGALAVTSGLESVNMVLLLLFVTALHGLIQRRGGAGADWSRLAVAAGAALSALFALTIATHIAVVLAADGLSEPPPAFELMWQLHAAAFALALPALGATFIGAALATHASGLTRPWQRLLGVVGGSLPILAGVGNLAIANGSPLVFVGVLGLATWLVWLVVTGLRLIRG